jgi:hypothetical protein
MISDNFINSISKSPYISNQTNKPIEIDENLVNIIYPKSNQSKFKQSRSINMHKNKKNKSNKDSKKNSKSKSKNKKTSNTYTQKRVSFKLDSEPNRNNSYDLVETEKDKGDFPQGNKFKCIGPCYPAYTLYYHPLTLQGIENKYDSCPIEDEIVNNKVKRSDKCVLNKDYDFDSYDVFADVIQVATSNDVFLQQIYNIKNIYDCELFLDNNIKQLPNLSQKRILNSIYQVYRDNDSFPSNNYLDLVKKLIKTLYSVKIKSKTIITKIMDNKHKKRWTDIFNYLIENNQG